MQITSVIQKKPKNVMMTSIGSKASRTYKIVSLFQIIFS